MRGLHLMAEFYHCACPSDLLQQAARLASLCRREVELAGLHCLGEHFHQFEPYGVTGSLVLAESHLNIHSWPELNALSLDIYVCNWSTDNRPQAYALYRALRRQLLPARAQVRRLYRGALADGIR